MCLTLRRAAGSAVCAPAGWAASTATEVPRCAWPPSSALPSDRRGANWGTARQGQRQTDVHLGGRKLWGRGTDQARVRQAGLGPFRRVRRKRAGHVERWRSVACRFARALQRWTGLVTISLDDGDMYLPFVVSRRS